MKRKCVREKYLDVFYRWSHWGAEEHHSRIEKKQIVLSNFLSLLLGVMAFPHLLYHSFFGSEGVMWILVGVELSQISVLLLNHFKKTVISRLFFVASSNLALYCIILVLGEGIQGHLLFFPFVMFPMLFFGFSRPRGIVFGIACSTLFYFLLVSTDFATPFYYPLSPVETKTLAYSLIITAFAMIVCATLYWSWLHGKVESELEGASQAKSRFLANMSHELRTPLNAIIGYTEILQEESEGMSKEEVQSDLGRVHVAAEKLLFLINDLLDLSKIEANQMSLELLEIDCASFLSGIEGLIQPMMTLNDNQLSVEIEPGLHSLVVDPQRLEQVLLNLLSNAAKFTSKGRVSLKAFRHEDQYVFEVADNGSGIPEAELTHLFDVFRQVSVPNRAKAKGSGLGLSIARQFCRLMGGDISLESTVGEGTTFTVRIQAPQAKAPSNG